MNHQAALAEALRSLLQRSKSSAFVIFEDKATKRFVQFALKKKHGLLLDLPGVALDAGEMDRATQYFERYGIQPQEYGPEKIFRVPFGEDVTKATKVTLEIFEQVYRLAGEWELTITTEPGRNSLDDDTIRQKG